MKNTTRLKEMGLSTEQIAEVQAMITAHSGSVKHPGIYSGEELVAKWCSKHRQYELAVTFPKNTRSKDGLYSHCRYAEKRAKDFGAKISKLQNKYFSEEDEAKLSAIKAQVSELNMTKNDYDFKEDVTDEVYDSQIKFEKKFKKELASI